MREIVFTARRGHIYTSPRSCVGTRSYMEGALMAGMPPVAKGQVLDGKFHPLVFDTTRLNMGELPVAGV